jgi:hypothetical protein
MASSFGCFGRVSKHLKLSYKRRLGSPRMIDTIWIEWEIGAPARQLNRGVLNQRQGVLRGLNLEVADS